jgi:GDPmannose 4,6-dehydratase
MLQQDEPDDYVIATGESHSVKEFVETAFELVGLDWQEHIRFDERYLRPAEVEHLLGDPTKAREKLGWQPRTTFRDLIYKMLEADLADEGVLDALRPMTNATS